MHGRQTQITDVVRRLGRLQRLAAGADAATAPPLTRFVAVIGGSGSGKSSLMRAGVVPYLRQYGIPEAGDLWESVVATPGTNFQPDADGVLRESPITRLAAKFEHVLRGGHSAQRCDAMAQMLRRDGGLGRMVDEFAPQLALPSGVRPEDACVLIVIDQFEELFHKTNAESADAKELIERVIDHFHASRQGQGSRKCFLAITMRSEHLNDCAGFLGLPEAINAGGYLVSRLGEAQLRDVIEKPAQRYLRLRQRERQMLQRRLSPAELAALPALPRTVAFEDGVVDRLVEATAQIEHDPDHLALLQHALARTWAAACSREGLQVSDLPQQIRLADLWRAGQADVDPPADPGERGNLLRLSLDTWAEHALNSHSEAEQAQVLDLMRRLAYKDLRTGHFNQQRLYVARHPLGTAALKALLQHRWIDDVDYLHWDAEDPQRVTLKVSHESFIRGWATLRALAEHEALRLDRFTQLLEAAQIWVRDGRPDAELLEQRLVERMNEAQVDAALGPPDPAHDTDADPETWLDWQRWLAQTPRGAALKTATRADVRDYLRCSREALAQRALDEQARRESAIQAREAAAKAQAEARTLRARQLGRLRMFGVVLLGTTVLAAFAGLVLVPVTVRAQHYFSAAGMANQVSPDNVQERIGGKSSDLHKLIRAARHFEQASNPERAIDPWTAMVAPLADRLLALPLLDRLNLASLLPDAAAAVEGQVNRQLHLLLTQSLWLAGAEQTLAGKGLQAGNMREMECSSDDQGTVSGTVTTEGGARKRAAERRGILVSDEQPESGADGTPGRRPAQGAASAPARIRQILQRRIHSVQVKPDGNQPGGETCELGDELMAMPFSFTPGEQAMKPAVMVDATLGYLYVAAPEDQDNGPAHNDILQVLRLRWPERRIGGSAELAGPITVVTDDAQATAELRKVVTSDKQLPSPSQAVWRTLGGRAMEVGGQRWQLIVSSAQVIESEPKAGQMRPLKPVATGHACNQIGTALQQDFQRYLARYGAPDEKLDLTMVEAGGYCLALDRTHRHKPDDKDPEVRDNIRVQVFRMPAPRDRDAEGKLTTHLVNQFDFGRVRHGESDWYTGVAGSSWDGWLVQKRPMTDASRLPYAGLAWHTAALRRLAESLCDAKPVTLTDRQPAAQPGKPPPPPPCPRQQPPGTTKQPGA